MAYSEEDKNIISNQIFTAISDECISLREVLKRDGMPHATTFYTWLNESNSKLEQYARACESRADKIFDEILTIADDQEGDTYIDANGNEQTNHNVIGRARLRVDARKWALSKMNPKKYGDKIETSGDINIKIGLAAEQEESYE